MEVQTCCGCCSLKPGTITVGVLCTILSIVAIVMDYSHIVGHEHLPNASWYFTMISSGLSVLFSILVVVAVLTDQVFLLLPWLFLYIWIIVGTIIGFVYMITLYSVNGYIWFGLILFAFGAAFIMIMMYAWVIVYSYLRKVKRDRMTGKILMPYDNQFACHNP
ncbi:uncharacterized protein LOC128884946 [Hylaeus volcanicus]|uniref:uncharacterized protein LOC128884946 n=1 Tax=Hylaeus volcanicus TaxID=313075 RepID=UPI0023B7EC3B|nr:uncharacterized protein LOC128884946 [Hylaeus volcanicus]